MHEPTRSRHAGPSVFGGVVAAAALALAAPRAADAQIVNTNAREVALARHTASNGVVPAQPGSIATGPFALRTLPDATELARLGLVKEWTTQVPLLGAREQVTSLLIHEGNVLGKDGKQVRDPRLFVETSSGQLYSLQADTGVRQWTAAIGFAGAEAYEPAILGNSVYAASGTRLVKLDRQTGAVIFQRSLPGAATAGPAALADDKGNELYVYVPVQGRHVYAFHLAKEQQSRFTPLPIAWQMSTREEIRTQPIVLGNRLVFAATDGTVYVVEPEQGNFIFRHFTGANIVAPVAVLDRNLFIPSSDFSLYAMDIKSGVERWRFTSGYPVEEKPIPFRDEVYVVPTGAGLDCVDAVTGVRRWRNERARRFVSVGPKTVHAIDAKGQFLMLDRKTGGLLAALPMPLFSVAPLNQVNDRIYLSTADGLVACLRDTAAKEPVLHPQGGEAPKAKSADAPKAPKKPKKESAFDDNEDAPKPAKKAPPKAEKKEKKEKKDRKKGDN